MEAANKEWNDLQAMSNEEYLQKTVLPVLYQGMKILDRDRPEAPLEYLSMFLLKNQHMVNVPKKPEEMI